jgi:hypothetical protein
MRFPSGSLLLLLKFARGHMQLTPEVIDAALEVLRYAWETFSNNTFVAQTVKDQNIIDCLEQALDEGKAGEEGTTAYGFTPSVWIAIGFWIFKEVLSILNKNNEE